MNNEEPMNNEPAEPAKELTEKELEGISGGNNSNFGSSLNIGPGPVPGALSY